MLRIFFLSNHQKLFSISRYLTGNILGKTFLICYPIVAYVTSYSWNLICPCYLFAEDYAILIYFFLYNLSGIIILLLTSLCSHNDVVIENNIAFCLNWRFPCLKQFCKFVLLRHLIFCRLWNVFNMNLPWNKTEIFNMKFFYIRLNFDILKPRPFT